MSFVTEIAGEYGVPADHLLVKYLERKTRASDRGSKARRSLGNLYALLVLAEDYVAGRTSRFTDLLARMKGLPFGSKLQNHPLDNRLNDEFSRQLGVSGAMLPVLAVLLNGQKSRTISRALLSSGGLDPNVAATFIVAVVTRYIETITENQQSMLEEVYGIADMNGLYAWAEAAWAPTADARLFEIVSYVILADFYAAQTVFIGLSSDTVEPKPLRLFRTGRTNANDGGIDFVLQPLGRFFQVSETMEVSKYFLDFEKINRYPLSFVIKFEGSARDAMTLMRANTKKTKKVPGSLIDLYLSLIEQIFTLEDLRDMLRRMSADRLPAIKEAIGLQFKLEYGLLD